MLKQEPHQSGYRDWIVNLSSIFDVVATQDCPAYVASKGAVSNLTRQVAIDYAKDDMHCNALCSSYTGVAIFEGTIKNQESKGSLDEKHPLNGCGTRKTQRRRLWCWLVTTPPGSPVLTFLWMEAIPYTAAYSRRICLFRLSWLRFRIQGCVA